MKNKHRTIPYSRQSITKSDIKAVIDVLSSDYLTQGPAVEKFETAIQKYTRAKYAVAFSSGTAGLHGACFAAGVVQGDEVITSPLTFAASANCVLYCGGTPVFADIQSDLPLIDYREIQKKISPKTKVIIPVDYSGIAADYDEINKIARDNNLVVIADAAHSFGGTYKNKKVGKLADMTVFSFHPVKSITTAEGGMVVTDNKLFAERLKMFRTQGIIKDASKFINKNEGPWYHEMQELGFNYRLTDIQAALGTSQLRGIEPIIQRRQKIADLYYKAFKYRTDIKFLVFPGTRTSSWHLFPVLFNSKIIRKKIVVELHKKKIMVQVHYIPVHYHPYYQKHFGYRKGMCLFAEEFYDRVLSLPIFPGLTNGEVNYIATSVIEILEKFK